MMIAAALLVLLQAAPPDTAKYFESLARPDGGYGWEDQADSHLTVTWAAVGSHRILGKEVPRKKEELLEFIRTHHPYRREGSEKNRHATELRTFVHQQIQVTKWLGADPSVYAEEVRKWTKPSAYLAAYERKQYPVLEQESMAFACRAELGLPHDDLSSALVEYLLSRRRPDGSFNNTPASDGGGGNVLNTAWAVPSLKVVGNLQDPEKTAAWLRSCQAKSGSFCPQPDLEIGRVDDIVCVWAAVTTLKALGSSPADVPGAVAYLHSLANEDGGFGYRPGLPSDPIATYYALASLQALGAAAPRTARAAIPAKPLPEGLKAYTVQIQAPGKGSPWEAVELARQLRIHLWGAKNAAPEWIREAQSIATRLGVPVTFCVADEEYGTYIGVPGLGTYSHVADLMAPAGVDFGKPMAGKDPSWMQFDRDRIAPLKAAGGFMVYQICDNRELSDLILDSGAYEAISTFHMRQNFFEFLPFLARYRHEIPFVSLQDAHGEEPWAWTDDLAAHRTVMLATEPTWEGWRKALRENWVVAIRNDDFTRFQTKILGGAPGVQDAVRRQEKEWEAERPLLSVVFVTPESKFEAARPEQGAVVRIRPGFRNNPQAVLLKPLVEVVEVTLDGTPLATTVEKKEDKGKLADYYLRAPLPAGKHVVAVKFRRLDTNEEVTFARETAP